VIVSDRQLAEGAHQRNPIASGDFIDLHRDNRVFTDSLRPVNSTDLGLLKSQESAKPAIA
jgi:hypothetical protein